MTEIAPRTNADRVAPVVDGVKQLARHFREHPDEAAVVLAPMVLLSMATSRARLPLLADLVVMESGYLLGMLLLKEYRAWKQRPAGPLPILKVV